MEPAPSFSDCHSVTQWIAETKQGESMAMNALWQRYFRRLVAYARQRLNDRVRRVHDEEDVVASVFESFFRAAESGRFPDLTDRDDLWRLLLRMTLRKTVDQHRKMSCWKAGNGKVRGESAFATNQDGQDQGINAAQTTEPSPELALEIAEQMERLLDCLPDERDREIAISKFQGYTNAEIARHLELSHRTVEYRLKLIRVKWSRHMNHG